jgi:hypothetical protein
VNTTDLKFGFEAEFIVSHEWLTQDFPYDVQDDLEDADDDEIEDKLRDLFYFDLRDTAPSSKIGERPIIAPKWIMVLSLRKWVSEISLMN